jgi:hypothetical protein
MTSTTQNDTRPYFGFNVDTEHGETVFVATGRRTVSLRTTERRIGTELPRTYGWLLTPAEARDLGVALISAACNAETAGTAA